MIFLYKIYLCGFSYFAAKQGKFFGCILCMLLFGPMQLKRLCELVNKVLDSSLLIIEYYELSKIQNGGSKQLLTPILDK